MTTDFSNTSAILATVRSILEAEELTPAATVLKTADARFEKMGHDNWNGRTDLYTPILTTSRPRSLLSIARSNDVRSRSRPCWSTKKRVAQTCLGFSARFAPSHNSLSDGRDG